MEDFRTLGVMLDCSRNAVPLPGELEHFIDLLAAMGYNALQLYTEDTYEIPEEPYFGYLRGRLTGEELRRIDAYAKSRGIELIPCIQTLAHLDGIFHWWAYSGCRDQEDVLLVGEERTYELIEHMFASLAKNFTSRRIHIGMDEAMHLGRGKYLDKHGFVNRQKLLCEHLARVCEIAEKYGFRPMMWGDMFYRVANNGEYYKPLKMTEEARAMVPEKLDLVYWDYYHESVSEYEMMIDGYRQFNACNETIFAGGAWTWTGIVPHNEFSLRTTRAALTACRKKGVRDVFITMWGDDGAECSYYSVLPALFYTAELAKGNTQMAGIKKKFREVIGEDFDKMKALDLPNEIGRKPYTTHNPSKYGLYNDLFRGITDYSVREEDGATYGRFAARLRRYAGQGGRFAYLYDTEAKLCRFLELKFTMGLRLRRAYHAGDREELARCAADIRRAEKRFDAFYEAFRDMWAREKKQDGFEIQQFRLGGLARRMTDCRRILEEYLDGKSESIPELEEELLPAYGTPGETTRLSFWHQAATAAIVM